MPSSRKMRNTLRSPRSPERNVSSVELSNLSTSPLPSQTSSEIHHPSSELHRVKDPQPQKLNPYVPFAVKNGWFFAKIILRSLSFIFALVILCIHLSFFIPVHDFGNIVSVVIVFFFVSTPSCSAGPSPRLAGMFARAPTNQFTSPPPSSSGTHASS